MRLSFKIIIAIWITLLLILAAVVYSAYSKLHPEVLIGLLRQQVEHNHPGTQLKVGSMDYRLALDFKLKLKNIVMVRNEKRMGSVGEIEIKIPWWLFISDKGSAQINITQLEVFLDHSKKAGGIDSGAKTPVTPIKYKASLPSYLLKAKYTLRAKDISIRDINDSHRYFNLSKLLVREFQYGKNSAFELTLPIEVNHNASKFNSELWLFGDLTPSQDFWKINYRGEFKTKDMSERFQLEDVVIDGRAEMKNDDLVIISNMNFLIERETIGQGKLSADKRQLSLLLEFSKFPLNYLGIINEEIKNPFLPELEGYAEGKLTFRKDLIQETTSLSSRLSFDGIFPLDKESSYSGKWQLAFDDSKWETSFITPNGEVSFFRRSIIDFDSGTLVQFNEEIGYSGIDLNKGLAPLKTLQDLRLDTGSDYFATSVSCKQCLQDGKKIDGSIKYGRSPHLVFYQANLNEIESKLKLSYQKKSALEQLAIEAEKFPWRNYKFLEPFFNADEAILDGKIQGKWTQAWSSGEWVIKLNVISSSLKGLLSEHVMKLYQQFDQIPAATPQEWHFELKKEKVDIRSLSLRIEDPVIITGNLFLTGTASSSLSLDYPKNKRWKPVKKDLGQFRF